MNETEKGELFWTLAEPLLATGRAERGTMMGFACLRSRGQFFASLERGTNNLIVALVMPEEERMGYVAKFAEEILPALQAMKVK